jgi:hypothetical protein
VNSVKPGVHVDSGSNDVDARLDLMILSQRHEALIEAVR